MQVSRKVGYVVLTKGPTGEWQPDWDGILHPKREDADAELQRVQGAHDATLGVVYDLLAVTEGTEG